MRILSAYAELLSCLPAGRRVQLRRDVRPYLEKADKPCEAPK